MEKGYISCNAEPAIPMSKSLMHKNLKRHYSSSKVRNVEDEDITEFSYSELQVATNNFSSDMLLGKGSHGKVYKAILRGGKLVVGVKKFKGYKRDSCSTTPADNEMEILSRVRNPGMVNLLGFCVDPSGEKLMVLEYMPNGTLYDQLHTSTCTKTKKSLSWRKRIKASLEIAKAVDWLHTANPPVIHRDIKSSNVLLDAKMRARLGDFGLALRGDMEDERVKCTPPAGTLGYLDPSYLVPGDLSTKTDVFSFGVLVLEIMSGRNAIDVDYSPSSIVDWAIPLIEKRDFVAICDQRIGPPANASITRQLALLASRCVAVDVQRRPEMGEVVKLLMEIRKMKTRVWSNNFTSSLRKLARHAARVF